MHRFISECTSTSRVRACGHECVAVVAVAAAFAAVVASDAVVVVAVDGGVVGGSVGPQVGSRMGAPQTSACCAMNAASAALLAMLAA